MMKSKLLLAALAFVLGVGAGAYWFTGVLARPLLDDEGCGNGCLDLSEILGLLAAAGIRHAPGLIPNVVKETKHCISMDDPRGREKFHIIIFPKRDIKDIAALSADDGPAVVDCLAHIGAIVRERRLRRYFVYTNGPRRQDVRYLHFHLVLK